MRMKKELQMLAESPPHGVSCWIKDNCTDQLEAQIVGADDTPYSGGIFKLEIQIPERYPFEPPKVQFVTPIYHPNIDSGGRICLDTLKMPPKGAWKPCMNVSSVLTSIQLLMTEPNPDDPLMTDISNEFKHNRTLFQQNARHWTEKHAQTYTVTKTDDVENDDTSVKCTEDTTKKGNKRMQPMSEATNKQPKTI